MPSLRPIAGATLRRLGLRRSHNGYAGCPGFRRLPPEKVLQLCYELLLHREPDPSGSDSYLGALRSGSMSPMELAERILNSAEWTTGKVRFSQLSPSVHASRCLFVRSLPPATRILDLGGTALDRDEGALVTMGYPYSFEEVVIVDLPSEARHELYREDDLRNEVMTSLGPVRYRYHSMSDLSQYGDSYFDLVYSGESIEHVSIREADEVLREVGRVLRPGGYLALDTPNARVTRLEQDEFIDPDHEYEYTHEEMLEKLRSGGFEVLEAKGLNYAGESVKSGVFSYEEVATNRGFFADIESCYLLAYVCRRRST